MPLGDHPGPSAPTGRDHPAAGGGGGVGGEHCLQHSTFGEAEMAGRSAHLSVHLHGKEVEGSVQRREGGGR